MSKIKINIAGWQQGFIIVLISFVIGLLLMMLSPPGPHWEDFKLDLAEGYCNESLPAKWIKKAFGPIGSKTKVKGEILDSSHFRTSGGGSGPNRSPTTNTFNLRFAYTDKEGVRREGICYVHSYWSEEDSKRVPDIEYLTDNPEIARVLYTTRSSWGARGTFFWLIPFCFGSLVLCLTLHNLVFAKKKTDTHQPLKTEKNG